MGWTDGLLGAVGGAFDYFGGKEANEANLQAGREATAARAADRDALIKTFTGTTGERRTTEGERGELDTQWLPGTSGAIAQQGDIGRATRVNELGDQFRFTLPDLASAKGVIGERDALNQGQFDTGMGQLISSNRRAIGPGSSGLTPSTARAIGDYVGQNRMNSPVDAINLFQGSRQRDISDLQQQIQANQRQAPTLTSPASAASAVLAQSPSIPARADLGSAILPGVGSNIVAQMQQREALAESRKQQNAILEAIMTRGTPVSTDRGVGDQNPWNPLQYVFDQD